MIRVYAIVLVVGVVALIAWIFMTVLAGNLQRPTADPEARFGVPGRRVVAVAVGFGMAGMSAEYSPLDIRWPLALLLAVIGGSAAGWYAGRVGIESEEPY
ncbi:MAG: hypothetical protein WD532_01870 [Acidimicrobiia bacterium]